MFRENTDRPDVSTSSSRPTHLPGWDRQLLFFLGSVAIVVFGFGVLGKVFKIHDLDGLRTASKRAMADLANNLRPVASAGLQMDAARSQLPQVKPWFITIRYTHQVGATSWLDVRTNRASSKAECAFRLLRDSRQQSLEAQRLVGAVRKHRDYLHWPLLKDSARRAWDGRSDRSKAPIRGPASSGRPKQVLAVLSTCRCVAIRLIQLSSCPEELRTSRRRSHHQRF
jgi:hypothetical protein